MKKRIYLAGKISGDPNYRAKFKAAQKFLEGKGYIVLNPAVLPSEGFSYEAYMRMSRAMLEECDAICFLPDWTDSTGALIEHKLASSRNMEMIFLKNIENGGNVNGTYHTKSERIFYPQKYDVGNGAPFIRSPRGVHSRNQKGVYGVASERGRTSLSQRGRKVRCRVRTEVRQSYCRRLDGTVLAGERRALLCQKCRYGKEVTVSRITLKHSNGIQETLTRDGETIFICERPLETYSNRIAGICSKFKEKGEKSNDIQTC